MKSDKRYTPQTIIEEEMKFSIPLYQRLFAWGPTQVNKLMEDLYDHYKGPIKDEPYYLGQMTIVPINGVYNLIDGQQRFTVMTLMGVVLTKYAPCWSDFLKAHNAMRLNFAGRTEDQLYIKQKIEHKSNETYSNAKMEQAIQSIENFLKEKVGENELPGFAEHIYTHISFFLAELPGDYIQDPSSLNKYFEAMNSTGKGLENHEILKVELMRGCDGQEYLTRIWNLVSQMERPLISYNKANEGIEQCRKQYQQAINYCMIGEFKSALEICISDKDDPFDVDVKKVPIAEIEAKPLPSQTFRDQTESSVISFPEFLLLVLDLTIPSLDERNRSDFDFYKKEKLLSRFKDYKPDNIREFYNNLLMYRLLLDFYIDRVEYIQGAGHHYLLFKDEEAKTHDCLRQYEAMLHVSTHSFYDWLKPALIYIKENHDVVSSTQLLSKLKEVDDKNHPFVNDIKSLKYGVVDRYWFWRLDYYLWEKRSSIFKDFASKEMKAIENYEFRMNRSIEHLHPQDESQNTLWDQYDLNEFGNLAMISQSFNSTQNNDSVKVKFARIDDQAITGDLQSLKLYYMYLLANKLPEGWNEEVAKANGEFMFHILKESYNR